MWLKFRVRSPVTAEVERARREVKEGKFLTDEEFEAIQRAHFLRKRDPAEQVRARKSLTACLEAISAFKSISAMAES